MSFILSIETSTNVCSVALHQQGKLIAIKEHHSSQSHSRLLAVFIQNILKEAEIPTEQIDAVAVSMGPGSYTGLRIGVASAKGLCYALSKPLIAINTLKAMAKQVQGIINESSALLCPMIDARRMEVYCLLQDSNQQDIMNTTAKIIDELSFKNYLDKSKVIFFGNGAAKCKSVIKHPNAIFLGNIHTTAITIGDLAIAKLNAQNFEDVAYFEPFYLKDFRVIKP
jgi:tRNA threonylcarbamoyladenosine biosynthesis protein TsaB